MSLLSCSGLRLDKAGNPIVDDVSLQLQAGELVGLVGPNGAGKSSLLSLLAGLERPARGSISLNGHPLHKVSRAVRSRSLAWLEQAGPVEWPLTVERIVSLGRRPHLTGLHRTGSQLGDDDREAVESALQMTDCAHLRDRDATTLSGGERSRMLLARALATEPQVLLADEPVAALDLGHQLQTMDVLRKFASSHQSALPRGCLVVLHDLTLAARYCDRLYLMNDGQFAAEGTPTEVLSTQLLRQVYRVDTASGNAEGVPWLVALRRRLDL